MPNQITWTSQKRKISELNPAPYNPRQLTETQAKDLGKSLERFNLADPIVINANNRIIGGHQRINILKTKGALEVDVRVPSRQLTEHEEKELNLRLNKNLGEWDYDLLADFDEDLLKDVGFESKELDKIFQLDTAEADDVPDARPTTDIKAGDIFTLGRHRVMCGDSTKREDVERLMDGKKADMVVTSPPYFNQRPEYAIFKTYDAYNNFLKEVVLNIKSIANNSFILCWNTGDNQPDCLPMIADQTCLIHSHGFDYIETIIWKKAGAVYSIPRSAHIRTNQHYYPAICWEPIIIFRIGKHPQFEASDCDFVSSFGTNHWEMNQVIGSQQEKIGHPAIFPLEIPIRCLSAYSKKEAVCFEPFCGSGSTLIACEQTNRICYGMEIDPIYCQVIVDRWEKLTGKKAEKWAQK